MANKEKKQKRVWVTDDITRKLCAEFTTSNTNVLNALKFSSYSDQAKKIRVRAMELMEKTQEQNQELMQEFHD